MTTSRPRSPPTLVPLNPRSRATCRFPQRLRARRLGPGQDRPPAQARRARRPGAHHGALRRSRRRARIVLSLLHAAGGALRMLVRECRPAAQRPLQCRRGSVRPRRAPHRGTLGTWRRGTRLAALRAGPFRRRARSRSWCVLGASTASAGVTISAPLALDVFGARGRRRHRIQHHRYIPVSCWNHPARLGGKVPFGATSFSSCRSRQS